jgi:hypothetical protein
MLLIMNEIKTMKSKAQMITDILQACVASGCYTSGELFFGLVAMNDEDLRKMCSELYIKTSL